MNILPIALVVWTAFAWALSQIMGKIVMREANSTFFNTVRLSMAVIVFTPIVLLNGLEIPAGWAAVAAVIDGIFGMALGLLIFFYCLKRAPAHKVIPAGNASPVWVLVLALLVLGEPLTLLLPASLALVLVGSFLLVQRAAKPGPEDWRPAVPLALLVAALYGTDLVLKKFGMNEGMDVMSFMWVSLITAAATLLIATLVTRSWVGQHVTTKKLGLIFGSSMLGHIIGTIPFMWALQMETVISIVPIVSLNIPFGFLMSVLLIRERPTLRSVLGMAAVFSGVVLAAI